MIVYLHQCEAASLQDRPVCVVGAGAAGISLAIALSRQGQRVLLVDAGDRKEAATVPDAYIGQALPPHPQTTEFRRQRLGGTTHLWGGRCVPLDAHDFAVRDHVEASGWPFDYEEYLEHLPEAMDYCDAGTADFSVACLAGPLTSMFPSLPALQPHLQERIERYSLPTDFAAKFGAELAKSQYIQVVLRARCTRLSISPDGSRIDAIALHDGRQEVQVRASCFVLCGGGLETTRLLLAAQRSTSAWARFDGSLGRYYACHYDLIFGSVAFEKTTKPRFDFHKTRDGVYARRKLQYSAEFLQHHGLLNSTFRLHFPAYADPAHRSGVLSTIYLAKSALASEHQAILNHGVVGTTNWQHRLEHLTNVLTDAGSVLRFGGDWLFKRKLARRKLPYTLIANRNGSYPLEFNSEQVPDRGNRIELLDAVDAQGQPRISVRWRLTASDIESGIASFQHMRTLLATSSDCRLDFDDGELRERISAALPVGGHHIGSTRMGYTARDSVVDGDGRVHGCRNLFIVSSSTFPTNGHANPTLSIVVLALRLARRLQKNPEAWNG